MAIARCGGPLGGFPNYGAVARARSSGSRIGSVSLSEGQDLRQGVAGLHAKSGLYFAKSAAGSIPVVVP